MSLDELIGADHRARLVWRMVEGFDLSALLAPVLAREGVAGHPQTDPTILVALWLYATLEGIGSARALARLYEQHHAYRWLCGGAVPQAHPMDPLPVEGKNLLNLRN